MFTEQVMEHLSYSCGCPLDVRKALGVVNGVCRKHKDGKLLFDNIPIEVYKKILEDKKKEIDGRSN